MHYSISMLPRATAHALYCKQPHVTIDVLENEIQWQYTTFAI